MSEHEHFDAFLSTLYTDTITFCGINMTEVEALKRLCPADYLAMFHEWTRQGASNLRVIQ